jgi:ApbE family
VHDGPDVRHIMGMPIGIEVRDPGGADTGPAFAWLQHVDATFSTYREDSAISRLDRGELTLAECPPEVDEVLTACLALERATQGFFSVRASGRLDPSGYVKGWAVAGAAERLAAAGARAFCINAGGDVIAHGRRWRVGRPALRHARRPGSRAGRRLRDGRVRDGRERPRVDRDARRLRRDVHHERPPGAHDAGLRPSPRGVSVRSSSSNSAAKWRSHACSSQAGVSAIV